MAIAFDAAGSKTLTVGSVLSWAHTTTGNNPLLIVAFEASSGGGSVVNNPTYAGQNLTKIITANNSSGTSSLWYLLNPPTGIGTINGTFSISSPDYIGVSMTYTGVDQSLPIVGSTSTTYLSQTSGSITTNISNGMLLVGADGISSSSTGTLDTSNGAVERIFASVDTFRNMGASNTNGTLRWTHPSASGKITAATLRQSATILFDAQGTGVFSNSVGSTYSITHTVGTGLSNSILLVSAWVDHLANGTTSNLAFAGTNLTQFDDGSFGTADASLWYLLNPPAGLGTLNGTISKSTGVFGAQTLTLYGVDQTTPIEVVGTQTATGSVITGTITTATDTAWVLNSIVGDSSIAGTFKTDVSQIVAFNKSAANGAALLTYQGPISPAASVVMVGTSTSTGVGSAINLMYSIKPFSSPPGTSSFVTFKTLLGAGNI